MKFSLTSASSVKVSRSSMSLLPAADFSSKYAPSEPPPSSKINCWPWLMVTEVPELLIEKARSSCLIVPFLMLPVKIVSLAMSVLVTEPFWISAVPTELSTIVAALTELLCIAARSTEPFASSLAPTEFAARSAAVRVSAATLALVIALLAILALVTFRLTMAFVSTELFANSEALMASAWMSAAVRVLSRMSLVVRLLFFTSALSTQPEGEVHSRSVPTRNTPPVTTGPGAEAPSWRFKDNVPAPELPAFTTKVPLEPRR